MNKKIFAISGMVVSALLIVFGIFVFAGVFGRASFSVGPGYNTSYDSGYAVFGNDYYTYTVNNMAQSADGAMWSARNLCQISLFLSSFCGIFTIGIGLLGICAFGVVFAGCESTPQNSVITPEESETVVEELWICNNCNSQNPTNALYCRNCGESK